MTEKAIAYFPIPFGPNNIIALGFYPLSAFVQQKISKHC